MGIDKNKWFYDSCNPLKVQPGENYSHEFIAEAYMRYCLTLKYTCQRDILDAGCGVGFGASLMSMRANSVVCANISQEELDYAKEYMRFYCPTTFECCDLNSDYPDKAFGLVASFETIEHLTNPTVFLKNVKNSLVKGGYFIFSVPKTEEQIRYSISGLASDAPPKGIRIGHRYAIRSYKQVVDMFSMFEHIDWYYQMDATGGAIIPDKYMSANKDMVKSWVGVCRI